MKNLLVLLAVILCAAPVSAQTNALFTSVPVASLQLRFDYPAAETHTNLDFKIWTSPSLTIPHTNWQVITQFSSVTTNLYTIANGTNTYTFAVPVWHGAQFYAASATDSFWGESFFSNIARTNPLPRTDNPLTITR